MAKINADGYAVSFTDKFFFDTNVWLLLFGTVANFQKNDQAVYSKLFHLILQRQSAIYINSLVISEFANVMLRKDFNHWVFNNKFVNQEYKRDFVGTSEYVSSVSTVSSLISKILALPSIVRLSDNFSAIDVKQVLEGFKIVDFNDAFLLKTCEDKDLILVTNDNDFFKVKSLIKIISI